MFYIGEITRYIMLDPKFLYKDYKGHIERIVRENVEGRCLGKKGYAIAVVNITDQKLGLIDNNTGGVKVTVKLQVLFMKFFINEVIDVVVSSVNEYGITVKAGPVEGIIWSSADVDGIPANYRFSTENGDCYERFGDDTEGIREIREGQLLRCKVRMVNSKDGGRMEIYPTIDDFFLG